MSGNIWFTSDTHFGHSNIVRGESKWENKISCRPFNTLEEHDDVIISNINKYVKENDVLYHLGDFSMGGKANVWKYRARINCKNIHLCLGNHDIHIAKNAVLDGVAAQDLFSSVQIVNQKKIGKTNLVMCHYAFRTWDKGNYGSFMIHGHSHNSLPPYEKLLQIADDKQLYKTGDLYKQIDVGLESAYELTREWRPFHIEEIRNIMENRINLGVDHHE